MWLLLLASTAASARRLPSLNPRDVVEPCLFPMPFTKHFDMFCQLDYHMTPYMCDPTGILSRTEAELLDQTVRSLNMTSCFCGAACAPGTRRLGIVIIPNATLSGLDACDSSFDYAPPSSVPAAAFQYAVLLSNHWSRHCVADLMLFYVRIWVNKKTFKAYTIPIYSNVLERLQRFSHPSPVPANERVLKALQYALVHSRKVRIIERHESLTYIPSWAKWLAVGLLSIVILSIYIANCVTNRLGKATMKQKPTVGGVRRYSDRFRAGFGGGMMMNTTPQKRGVMMFRTFQKTPRYGTTNRL